MNKILLVPHPKLRQKSESIDKVTEIEINSSRLGAKQLMTQIFLIKFKVSLKSSLVSPGYETIKSLENSTLEFFF